MCFKNASEKFKGDISEAARVRSAGQRGVAGEFLSHDRTFLGSYNTALLCVYIHKFIPGSFDDLVLAFWVAQ